MNKICYIFGAGNCDGAVTTENSFIISADGGYEFLKSANINPDIIMGDFDSLGYIPKGERVITFPSVKDDTDTSLAVKMGIEKGFNTFVIYGGLGGRLDHTVANIQLLNDLAQKGFKGFLVGEGNIVTAVSNGEIAFDSDFSGFVSSFSLCENARGVYMSGLKYTLCNAEITNTVPLGVSNEFTGENAKIRVENGTLTVMWRQNPDEFINKFCR